MIKKSTSRYLIFFIVFLSLALKITLIIKYKNALTLSSDDLNYIKSAVALLKRGVLTFHNFNEPTVFIMPLYPMLLAAVFKLFGYGLMGMQVVRLIQAVLSCITVIVIFLMGKLYFNEKIAVIAAFLVAFYVPNIVTVGYMLTETLFTALLCILIYLSLKFSHQPGVLKFMLLGLVWALATLCRPTIALYPVLLFFYILVYIRMNFSKAFKYGMVMAAVFALIMCPWWIRNYREYGEFIPLAASSGNPMLQGTYIDYRQTPENTVYYKLGENSLETNKTEVAVSKMRIQSELKKDFWGYLKWFIFGKTYYLWNTIFYWKAFFGISSFTVLLSHYIILMGFLGIVSLFFGNMLRYILPISVIAYFNAVHCLYMAFDRYAFPLLPLLSVFSAYFFYSVYSLCKSSVRLLLKNGY